MKNITFRQFINTFNFRYIRDVDGNLNNMANDTRIIRIHLSWLGEYSYDDWFEFGIYDFDSLKMKRIESIFSKDLLDSYVQSISFVYNNDEEIEIYLTADEESDVKYE